MTDALQLTDDVLAAYLDRELDAETAREVERMLSKDPAARAKLADWRWSGAVLRDALDDTAEGAPPTDIIAAIEAAPGVAAKAADRRAGLSTSAPLSRALAWIERVATSAPAWALSLGLAMVVGATVGQFAAPPTAPNTFATVIVEEGPIDRASPLHVALETAPSGRDVALGDERFKAIFSFRDTDGQICREFNVAPMQTDRQGRPALMVGVACRGPRQQWRVERSVIEHAAQGLDEALFQPASGPLHEAVDAYVDARISNGAFTSEEEAAQIREQWGL